jgi:hypothetical protein
MTPLNRKAVLASKALLAMESLKQYGLIEGGPEINVERCEEVIAWGDERGLEFTQEEVNGAAVAFWREWNAERAAA